MKFGPETSQNGSWSAPATWEGGKVPGAGARVQIRTGHVVTYDMSDEKAAAIRSIHVAGTLTFARDRDTRLCVGLIKIQPGDDASENGFDCDAHAPEPKPGEPLPALETQLKKSTSRVALDFFREVLFCHSLLRWPHDDLESLSGD